MTVSAQTIETCELYLEGAPDSQEEARICVTGVTQTGRAIHFDSGGRTVEGLELAENLWKAGFRVSEFQGSYAADTSLGSPLFPRPRRAKMAIHNRFLSTTKL
jgi:hypothetical protein